MSNAVEETPTTGTRMGMSLFDEEEGEGKPFKFTCPPSNSAGMLILRNGPNGKLALLQQSDMNGRRSSDELLPRVQFQSALHHDPRGGNTNFCCCSIIIRNINNEFSLDVKTTLECHC